MATEDAVSGAVSLRTFEKATIVATPGSFTLVVSFKNAGELHAAMKGCLGLDFDDSELARC